VTYIHYPPDVEGHSSDQNVHRERRECGSQSDSDPDKSDSVSTSEEQSSDLSDHVKRKVKMTERAR
jgi:hypothetical protein